jgi:chlorophyllase
MTSVPASASASATKTTQNVFDVGKYETVLRTVETGTESNLPVPPPQPLLIAMPSEAGEFPLLVFVHGYLLSNSFYSQLIQHIASHGFIVIAPKASLSLSLSHSHIHMHNFSYPNALYIYIYISFNKYI